MTKKNITLYGGNQEELKICLKNKWIIKDQEIGKGVIGRIYPVCEINRTGLCDNNYKYVIKIYTKNKNSYDAEASRIASEINIGPTVHETGICKGVYGYEYNYIIMDKLERTLTKTQHTYNDIINTMVLYHNLLKNDVIQNDLKSDNIMYDANNNIKIIDFSHAIISKNMTDDIILKEMIKAIKSLWYTLNFENDWDKKKIYNEQINQWFVKNFGTQNNVLHAGCKKIKLKNPIKKSNKKYR